MGLATISDQVVRGIETFANVLDMRLFGTVETRHGRTMLVESPRGILLSGDGVVGVLRGVAVLLI